MYLFLLFNLFALTNGFYFGEDRMCNQNTKDKCLDSILCSWCNISKNNNTERVCKYASVCLSNFTEESNCIYNDNYDSLCNFFGFMSILTLLFVLSFTSYSVSYVVLQNFENYNREKNSCVVISTITGLIYVPGLILWITFSKYLVFYLFSLILLSFFTCLFGGAKKYIKYKQNKGQLYSTIN